MPLDEDKRGPSPAPRWVKVGAVVALVLVVLVILMLLLGGGDHGPGRHLGGDRSNTAEGHPAPGSE